MAFLRAVILFFTQALKGWAPSCPHHLLLLCEQMQHPPPRASLCRLVPQTPPCGHPHLLSIFFSDLIPYTILP